MASPAALMPPILRTASALALGWVLLPFYGAVMWALIIALLFAPLYRRLRLRFRLHRNAAAALVVVLVLVVGVLPTAVVSATLAREASAVYQHLHSGTWNPGLYLRGVFDALPGWLTALLQRAGVPDFDTLQRQVTQALAQGSQVLASHALGMGLDTVGFVASLGVTVYLAFFLVRDGESLAQIARGALPVPPQFKQELIEKFLAVVRATVKGNLLVACIQGALGGFAFWALGVPGALLWAAVMAFLALVPLIGAGLVWLPMAAYFLMTGDIGKGLTLVAYGMLVIGLADNVLRPMLVGKDAGMPNFAVMISTLGGIAVFGINGFIIGPTIAAMFIAVWHLPVIAQEVVRQAKEPP